MSFAVFAANNCIATEKVYRRGIFDNEFGTRSCRYGVVKALKAFVVEKNVYRHCNRSDQIRLSLETP
jgi:hypothetical protein